jgi:hypothetical protein
MPFSPADIQQLSLKKQHRISSSFSDRHHQKTKMETNATISPDTIQIKQLNNFAAMQLQNRDRTTEITIIFNPSHIQQLHNLLNFLYQVRYDQEKSSPTE